MGVKTILMSPDDGQNAFQGHGSAAVAPLAPVAVSAYTLTSALGAGVQKMRESLCADRGGLSPEPWPDCTVDCQLGRIELTDEFDGDAGSDAQASAQIAAERDSRNNRTIALALAQDNFSQSVAAAIAQFGAPRVGLVMGTSTSSIDRTERAYRALDAQERFPLAMRQPLTHNPPAPGDFVAAELGIAGPRLTISAACASSAKVFATAQRWLHQGLVDAVVVGGADSLCLSVIYGFHSLQLVAAEACRPFDTNRSGISLGEAAGFALLTADLGQAECQLLGTGESCDAYHMSSAHPEGLGARLSMQRALAAANLEMRDIDYLNLHGTGTRANDATEGSVCAQLLGNHTLASATKSWTGHTLGAAGIVEAVLCLDALATGFVPGTRNTTDVEADFSLLLDSQQANVRTALSNSFGFGGNNCSVVFGKA